MFQLTDTVKLSEEGAWVHIEDRGQPAYLPGKDGKPDKDKPVRIKVYGPDSPTLKELLRKRAAKLLKEDGQKNIQKMSSKQIEAHIESREEVRPSEWADRTIAWENVPSPDGGLMDFSRDAAERLYTQFPAILEQLIQDAGAREDFLALT